MVKCWAQRFFSLFVLFLFLLLTTSNYVFAQENDIYKKLQWPFYDPGLGSSCTTPLLGSDNAEQTWNYFKSKGLGDKQTAAILGNFKEESGINPKTVQGNPPYESETVVPGRGYGIAQWTDSGRQKNLINFASSSNKPVSSLDLQLNFAYHEMTDSSPHDVLDHLKTINDVEGATRYFHSSFEASADDEQGIMERVRAAIRYYNLYSGTAPLSDPSPNDPVCDESGPGAACLTGNILGWTLSGDCRMVSYDQGDPRWANHPYGAGKTSLAASGCGPTSMAMVAATLLKNTDITPVTIADRYGDTYHTDGTNWSVFPVFAKDYGQTYQNLGTNLNAAAEIIRNGGLVIISVGSGHFTGNGHFMVIRAINQDGTQFYLADPNGDGYSHDSETRSFSADFLRGSGSMLNLWGFSK